MLITAKSMRELDFQKLLNVYSDELTTRKEQEMFYLYLLDFFCDSNVEYHIWFVDGEYRCALRTEPYRDGCLVAGLHTAVDQRCCGYAKRLISAVCDCCNVPIYAHVEKRNIPSLRVHLSCGFREIHDYAVFIDGSVSWNSCTLCYNRAPCRF